MTTATNSPMICPNCDETVDREKLIKVSSGDIRCDCCVSDDCFVCDNCGDFILDTDCFEVQTPTGTGNVCGNCKNRVIICCYDCGNYVYDRHCETTVDGNDICWTCYQESYTICETCDTIVHLDDAVSTEEGYYCANCHPYETNFCPAGFRNSFGRTTEIGSARCFGVELETDRCDGYTALEDTKAWGAKPDPTVSGKEFYSDILSGDEGLDAIREWGELASQKDWYASSQAGYHLHLDMRSESDDSLYAIAYAYRKTQEVWQSFVCNSRHNNNYSYAIQWSCHDIDRAEQACRVFGNFARGGDRYQWCNLAAYGQHQTFEIRLHEGTCDALEVINWIKAHTRFADWASELGYEGVKKALDGLTWDDMFTLITQKAWKSLTLSTYYSDKARYHNHGFLTSERV